MTQQTSQQEWDARWLQVTALMSTWSKDPRCGVAACIVNEDKQLVSTAYNGFPKGASDDERLHYRSQKLKMILHAEETAIMNAKGKAEGCTIYINKHPCLHCCSVIAQAGIKRVVFVEPSEEFKQRWNFDESIEYLRELQINVSGYKQVD